MKCSSSKHSGSNWVREARRRALALTCGPGSTMPPDSVLNRFKPNQIYFKRIQICPKLWPIQKVPSLLQKLEIEYGWKEVEITNSIPYRNSPRFEMEFELKIRELLMSWNSLENSLENLGTLDFDEIWPASSWLHVIARKNHFPSKED
jgi:hypothetical protein